MNNKSWYCIGVMSGTSLDGVDIIYVKFNSLKPYQFKILKSQTLSYSDQWKERLLNAFTEDERQLKKLDVKYGKHLGSLIKVFIEKNKINKVDFITSHGHTIFHKPKEKYTLQIGAGQTIADITKKKVICDFRTQDVNFGGQGAPLVPIGDELLFSRFDFCLNLGGFANISFKKDNTRIAFDICPVNIVLNYYANKMGYEYDNKGKIASKGTINYKLLEKLNTLDFYKKIHPKSLGFEWVNDVVFPLIESFDLKNEDILRTFIEHTAIQISTQLKGKEKSVLITGGGVFNDFLMLRLSRLSEAKIIIPKKEIIEYKEALIFGFLGLLKMKDEINVLSSVTGAKKDHSSGEIFKPKA